MPDGIPDKGDVLTQMSAFWFELTGDVVPNHFMRLADGTRGRQAAVRAAARAEGPQRWSCGRRKRIDVECVVRGYLTGSAWAEYKKHGTSLRRATAAGLVESEQLLEPIFTPTTKADEGPRHAA